mmetsp:Transcript_49322/g.121032  ORF Transcript_49322/g.121032 Transcript_49322/m.121032 type:complete len:82 (+) Transcript_49322:603-848(+)
MSMTNMTWPVYAAVTFVGVLPSIAQVVLIGSAFGSQVSWMSRFSFILSAASLVVLARLLKDRAPTEEDHLGRLPDSDNVKA